ncbi:hypothetical protein LMH87_009662 [Akanthomyces muscarius]|uniref:Uncharacterized protein n=1 Tax=Akanthomyces muscarius TaxID=2231603 RepID=A0A9W8UM38_AKAMU|nr:hypothetical protein LMH87_009662 [Akanthomyces muscarius]KAJ4153160.1 hypothetical protein LMH87_009662 [Akanthomyces muscarius]
MRRTYLLSLLAAVSTAAAVVPESDLNELDTRAIFGRQCFAACRCPGGEGLSCCSDRACSCCTGFELPGRHMCLDLDKRLANFWAGIPRCGTD